MPTTLLRVGAARRTIALPAGELVVRALALRFGPRVVLLATCGLASAPLDLVAPIRAALAQRSVAPEALLLLCTGALLPPELALEAASAAIVNAMVEALAFDCPVRMRATQAAGDVAALQFERPSGEIMATVLAPAGAAPLGTGVGEAVERSAGGVALCLAGAVGADAERQADALLAALGQAGCDVVWQMEVGCAALDLPGLDQPPAVCTLLDLGAAQLMVLPAVPPPALLRELRAALPGPAALIGGALPMGDMGQFGAEALLAAARRAIQRKALQ